MAARATRHPHSGIKVVGPITGLRVLNKRLEGTETWSRANELFSRGDSWVVYLSGDPLSHYASVVGNLTGSIPETKDPPFKFLRTTVKEGLPRVAFDRIKGAIATTTEELSSITEIPKRTIARRRRFKPDESERLLRVASAFQKTLELFGDLDKARKWFTTAKSALAGLTPIACCDTETGCKEVENLLGRIDESVYS